MLRNICWLMILSAVSGCTVGPDYREVMPQLPEQWQAAPANEGQNTDIQALKTWWQSFADAELDALMHRALANNLDVKIALARVDQARAERRGTRAELFPTINAVGGAQRQNNPFPGLAPGIKYNMFELGFDALWEIDLFGRLQRRSESAAAELDAAGEQYRLSLVTLSAEVARSYIAYRSLQNQLRIIRDNLESQRHTLSLTEKLLDAGVGTRHDLVRARAQVETTAAQLPALEAEKTGVLHQLEVLLGQQPGALDAELETASTVPAAPAQFMLASPAATIQHRPDVRYAERRLAAACAMQGAAIAELFPKISLSAFLGLRNTDIESLFKSAAFSYGTAANLVQPLLNFGRIQAGIDIAEAKQQEAFLAYQKAVLQALQETETALSQYLQQEIRRQALARSVAYLQDSVHLSERRYQEGIASFLEVLDAQRSLFAAQLELARSQEAVSTGLIAIYKALGGAADAAPEPQEAAASTKIDATL